MTIKGSRTTGRTFFIVQDFTPWISGNLSGIPAIFKFLPGGIRLHSDWSARDGFYHEGRNCFVRCLHVCFEAMRREAMGKREEGKEAEDGKERGED